MDISTALVMPFKFPASSYTASVVDAAGTNTRTFITSGLWYIIEFAHTSSPLGTVDDPVNLLKHIETEIGNTRWRVSLNSDGKVAITNLGASTASITFATTAIPFALGFISTATISVGAGATVTGTYQPTHCIFAFSREEDTGWRSKGQIIAAADLPDGSVYGWSNGYARWERGMVLKYHPKDKTKQTGTVSNITVAYPEISSTEWKNPTDSPIIAPPFSAHRFLNSGVNNGVGKYIAACFGNFQANIAGTDLTFEQVSLTANSLNGEHFVLSIPSYDKFRNIDNLKLSFYAHKSRNTT